MTVKKLPLVSAALAALIVGSAARMKHERMSLSTTDKTSFNRIKDVLKDFDGDRLQVAVSFDPVFASASSPQVDV